jgi:ArsR family transcriptional regulator
MIGTAMKTPDLVTLFQALADPTRLRLLNLMTSGEVCVCFFVDVLGESQPKISRHLAYLRRAGVVQARRDGKWIHYRLIEPPDAELRAVLSATIDAFKEDRQMRRDRLALERACCAVKLPGTLGQAPRPVIHPVARS